MKKILRVLSLISALLMCFSLFAACSTDGDKGTTNDSNNSQTNLLTSLDGCKIIYSSNSEYSKEVAYAMQLQSEISSKLGITLELGDDYLGSGESYDDSSVEILVGHTAYAQSQKHKDGLDKMDYRIAFEGNKVVLMAGRASGLEYCVTYFVENYLAVDGGKLTLKSNDEYLHNFDYSTLSTSASLATLNLRFAKSATENAQSIREPRIVKFITDKQPDSIGFQECEAFWRERLDAKLNPLGYVSAQDEVWNGEDYAFKNFIYYNTATTELVESGVIWLSATPTVPSKGYGSSYYNSASWAVLRSKDTGEQYVHVNTHLNVDSASIRAAEINVLLAKVKTFENKGLSVFITGDFNDEMTTQTYATMTATYLDARKTTSDTLEFDYTYNNYNGENVAVTPEKQNLIDYCFYKGEGITIDKLDIFEKYNGGYMSDHNAMIVKFTIK